MPRASAASIGTAAASSAELGADFKLTWFDPETEKSWKTLPASAPDEIKTEVKTLTKLMRETVKGQTARLGNDARPPAPLAGRALA